MSEVKKGNGLVYKNHPLRRIDNLDLLWQHGR